MLNISIISENTAYRQTLVSVLKVRFPMTAITDAGGAKEVLNRDDHTAPDLVFVDIHRSDGKGVDLIRELRTRFPDMIIVGLADYEWPEYQTAVENAGADHFVPIENSTRNEVLSLLETSLRDKGFMK